MAAKYIPTEEKLTEIMRLYDECGTYSKVAKMVELSVPVVTRIIKEQKQVTQEKEQRITVANYTGPLPPNDPPVLINCFEFSEEWLNNYRRAK